MAAVEARPASENWLVVLTTDHGGEGTNHGEQNAACQTIPLVIWGSAVSPGDLPDRPSHLDVFPTVLTHFGAPADSFAHAVGVSRVPTAELPPP
jgi:arylsulfatase A-like enzyme